MNYIQINYYYCKECGAKWKEFRVGPRLCPVCEQKVNLDDLFPMPVAWTVTHEGACVVMDEEKA